MSGPNSKPEAGQQDYRTPQDFLAAVQRKFGVRLAFDLACTTVDCVVPTSPCQDMAYDVSRFGFCCDTGADALASAWPTTPPGEAAWCNPPFGRSGAFARVASESMHCRSILLIPASVGSNWFAEHVAGIACVVFLRPRIVFNDPQGSPVVDKYGQKTGINRDCMLAAYGWAPGMHCEDWRKW